MNLNNLGILQRAGKVVVGRRAIKFKGRRIKLIILARDLSDRTKRDMREYARKRRIEVIDGPSMEELGRALGRRPCGVIGIVGEHKTLILKE